MTPAQLEALESDLRERAKPLGDRHWIDGTSLIIRQDRSSEGVTNDIAATRK